MNVSYEHINPADAATILGVTPSVVCSWCRKKYIKAINMSDGSVKARWMIPDAEVQRVSDLMTKYGKRMWMTHNEPQASLPVVIESKPLTEEKVMEYQPESKIEPSDEFIDLYYKIKDIKEELNNLDARKNQLMHELEDMKQQLMDKI